MVKKGDFVRIEYTGRIKDSGDVFDTTDEALAKEKGIYEPSGSYGPRLICVGKGHVLRGLDAEIEKHDIGDSFAVELSPEDAFGKKSAKLIQLISTGKFRKEGINPVPGMRVNVDNMSGTIKSVSGGRTLVDFNHPLAGRELVYEVKIVEGVDDKREQVSGMVEFYTGLRPVKVEYESGKTGQEGSAGNMSAGKGDVSSREEKSEKDAPSVPNSEEIIVVHVSTALPDEIQKIISGKIKELVDIRELKFVIGKE